MNKIKFLSVSSLSSCVLFGFISTFFIAKYVQRVSENFLILSGVYCAFVFFLIWFLKRFFSKIKSRKFILISLGGAISILLCLQIYMLKIPVEVDRWSALANPINAMFHGVFPYSAQTHLGGYASPFPMSLTFHIPFYFLGNAGFSFFFALGIFLWSLTKISSLRNAFVAFILLLITPNLWWEVAVRSDLMTNFLLLSAFVNFLIFRRNEIFPRFHRAFFLVSVCAGLLLSTRLSTAFPLLVILFPFWLKLPMKSKILMPLIIAFVFCLTFLPLAIWDWKQLFFAEFSPFVLQTRQGTFSDSVIVLVLGISLSLIWSKNNDFIGGIFFCAVIVFLLTFVAYFHSMWADNSWNEVFQSRYDISYFNAALPFLASFLAFRISGEKLR